MPFSSEGDYLFFGDVSNGWMSQPLINLAEMLCIAANCHLCLFVELLQLLHTAEVHFYVLILIRPIGQTNCLKIILQIENTNYK